LSPFFFQAIVHPLLPLPFTIQNDPNFIEIEALEKCSVFRNEVLPNLKANASEVGSASGFCDRVLPRGAIKAEGINLVSLATDYHWTRINGTKYQLLLVLHPNETNEQVYGEWECKGVSNVLF
jgi:hypothetical protein